jgi:hypothetical protein
MVAQPKKDFITSRLILLPLLAGLLANCTLAASDRQTLAGHVPGIVSQLQPAGRLEGSQRLKLAIGMASRDEEGLDSFIRELYDPASPNYHHYLSPEQFTARFGPAEQDYQALTDYAKASGLNITRQYPNRVVLDVEGAVADIEKALQVTLRTYQHPTEARVFYAPDVEPSIPLGIPVLHIEGLNNYTLPHPRHARHASDVFPKVGSAPDGQLWGNDFRYAYAPGATLTGAGQNLGLLEFEGYYAQDIIDYEDAIGMSAGNRPQMEIVSLDGGATPSDGGDNGEECSIDIEMAASIAPGLSKIYVFEDGAGIFDDVFESMVSHTDVLQFSCSWGGSTNADPTSEVLFKEMAAQGQSFFNASGDSGAFVGAVEFPSDSPNITQVGGTTLIDGSAPSYPWESEVVWNWGVDAQDSYNSTGASGGGISTYYHIPSWQTNISMTANLGSTTWRNIPDVSANADNCYIYSDNGQQESGWGGTSCAAPLWAGFTALVNQQAAATKMTPVGFLNPALYTLASRSNHASYFHDITSGTNTWTNSPNKFHAVAGYDLCCGLGTMNGMSLIDALAASSQPQIGSLQVTISPVAAITNGAQWRVDGGTNNDSGAIVAGLSAGSHTVSFTSISGWNTPPNRAVTIQNNETATTTGTYSQSADLILITNGDGTISHTAWPVALVIGKSYTATAVPKSGNIFSNWMGGTNQPYSVLSSSAGYTFVMRQGLALEANFETNVFLAAQGTYRGLFAPASSPRQQTDSGAFLFSLTSGGAVSGHLDLAGQIVPLSGKIGPDGTGSIVSKPANAEPSLTTTLQIDFAGQSVSGTVSNSVFIAGLNGCRDGFSSAREATNLQGRYTFVIPGTNDPAVGPLGTSCATVKVDSLGNITLAGFLADGTSISQSSVVSQGGNWPLYVNLYGGKGSLWGWNYFSANHALMAPAALSWINATNSAKTAAYRSGFTNQAASLAGGFYAPAQTLPPGLAVTLEDGNFTLTLTNWSRNTNKLTLATNRTTGAISGSFANPVAPKQTLTFHGVIQQDETNAQGYFSATNQSGTFLLQNP